MADGECIRLQGVTLYSLESTCELLRSPLSTRCIILMSLVIFHIFYIKVDILQFIVQHPRQIFAVATVVVFC